MQDAFTAVALSSFLNTPDRVSYPIRVDGAYVVFVHTTTDVPRLKERIRLWADLQDAGEVVVQLEEALENGSLNSGSRQLSDPLRMLDTDTPS
ncbi:MAG TPA: hypothetical protein VG652_06065 [Gaiellaceae bacterium]|nr:hypothetical protein [Gaiellaceae bacterium]